MNIIEKDSAFFVEKNGKFCHFNRLKGAECMLSILRMMDNNKIPELSLVDVDEKHFDIKYNTQYLCNLKKWIEKHSINNSDFYEDEFFNINFIMNNRTVTMSPYASSFMISYKEDYEFERGREMILKTPRTEDELISVLNKMSFA